MGLFYLLGACVFSTVKTREILAGPEIIFLKKVGFSGMELFAALLTRLKSPFFVMTAGYAAIYGLDAAITPRSAATCLSMSVLAFLAIVVTACVYTVIFNSINATFLKDVAVCGALVFLFARSFFRTASEGLNPFEKAWAMLKYFGNSQGLELAFSAFFRSLAFLGLITVALIAIFWAFFRERFKSAEMYSVHKAHRRRNVRYSVEVGNPVKSFLKRDLGVAFSSKLFLASQIGLAAVGAWFLNWYQGGSAFLFLIAYCALVCWIFAFKIQDVYAVDAQFANLYRTLPIRFGDFIFTKALLAASYSLPCPLGLSLMALAMGKITILDLLVIIAVLALWSELLFLYNSSIIFMFFPKVKDTTDLPLLLGDFLIFVPFVPLLAIFFGMRQGSKKWRAW
jgi:hypothetical protein